MLLSRLLPSLLLGSAIACTPSQPRVSGRDRGADSLRAYLLGTSRWPVVGDTSRPEALDSARLARDQAWHGIDTSTVWFTRDRPVDLTGDGVADHFAVVAKGTRSDSLVVRIVAVVGRDTFWLDGFYGNYLLIDPPFPRDTAREVVDAYVRGSLIETIDSARIAIDSLTPEYFDERGADCGRDFPGCLREALGEDSVRLSEFQDRLAKEKFYLLSYNYGYESSITIFWFAPLKRFLGIYECC